MIFFFQAITSSMQRHDSGLDVRDRNWLKITIHQAFIGKIQGSKRIRQWSIN